MAGHKTVELSALKTGEYETRCLYTEMEHAKERCGSKISLQRPGRLDLSVDSLDSLYMILLGISTPISAPDNSFKYNVGPHS